MRTLLVMVWVMVLVAVPVSVSQDEEIQTVETVTMVAGSSPQVTHGAELFDLYCSACHGDTAQGLAEAQLSFPADHRDCTSCHRTNNPPQMEHTMMRYNYAFSIGEPPALHGDGTLASFPNGFVLYHYIRATMPRPFPGMLADDEYLAITAFLLELHQPLPASTPLSEENAAQQLLRGAP
ncbi:MAG: hypothetical protein U5L04_14265 [Trueperaceae bacterium]|nr:hypothetical protein [Trueperaceae bacterium]